MTAEEVHLVLAGPNVGAVTDDPEGAMILHQCMDAWRQLPPNSRHRIHLACIPMTDSDEGSAIVNALQRHSTIVTQKSIAEGFGLTVAEAMWKTPTRCRVRRRWDLRPDRERCARSPY